MHVVHTLQEIRTRTPANPNKASRETAMPQAAWEDLLRDAVQGLRRPHTPETLRRWLQTTHRQAWAIGAPQAAPPTPPPPHREGKGQGQGKGKGSEAGSDPRGHLWVTWGVYLCAGKPPLADIILSHPIDLTRCDSVIGLAIPAMSGHIQY